MRGSDKKAGPPDTGANPVVRAVDAVVVAAIHGLILLARLRSRDPTERISNLFKPDHREMTRIRNYRGVLEWSPRQRVGCFAGVLIGTALGGAVLWYGLN